MKDLTAEFRGLYGISETIEGVPHSHFTIVVGVGQVCYYLAGENGHIYWVLAEKLPQKLHFPHVPKYTDIDAIAYAEARLEKPLLSDTTKLKFGDLWEKRLVYALVNTEEGNLKTWTAGNIVCIGDIIHKVRFRIEPG